MKEDEDVSPVRRVIIVGGGIASMMVATTIVKKTATASAATAASAATSANNKIKIDVTIIDKQNYLDWSIASPRMVVNPDTIVQMGYIMPLDKVIEHINNTKNSGGGTKKKKKQNGNSITTNIKFLHGMVKKVSNKDVTLEDGTILPADVIIIATGGQYHQSSTSTSTSSTNGGGGGAAALWKPTNDQTTKELRIAGIRLLHENIKASNHILIVGCGPTGIEIAGEIKSTFPSKKVTIVGTMLPNSSSSPTLQRRMKDTLQKRMGIVVIDENHPRIDLNNINIPPPDKDNNTGRNVTVTTTQDDGSSSSSTTIIQNVDLVLNASGFIYQGRKLADDKTLLKDVTDRGQFNCRFTLQLQSYDNVFCCGDILAIPTTNEGSSYYADVKGSKHAEDTGEIVGENVVRYLLSSVTRKKDDTNTPSSLLLKEFKWSKVPIQSPMLTALGTSIGIGYFGENVPFFLHWMENFITKQMKCHDYYMSMKGKFYGKGITW